MTCWGWATTPLPKNSAQRLSPHTHAQISRTRFLLPLLTESKTAQKPPSATSRLTCWSTSSLVLNAVISLKSFVATRSEEHTSELQSRFDLVCRLLLDK